MDKDQKHNSFNGKVSFFIYITGENVQFHGVIIGVFLVAGIVISR
jgi:hypothetical protein